MVCPFSNAIIFRPSPIDARNFFGSNFRIHTLPFIMGSPLSKAFPRSASLPSLRLFPKQVFQPEENGHRQSQCSYRRVVRSNCADRNAAPVRKGVGNDLKSLAIHVNVASNTVTKVLDL